MNPRLHARAKELFLAACELGADEREAFLARTCGAEAELRAAVDELLASDAVPAPLLAAADGGGAARWLACSLEADDLARDLPARVGPYRILRLLGRGGMGVVYEAEQENPRRSVALKVLSVGLASPENLRRFRQEAQLLGRLHHPGIAHVYSAGTAEFGGLPQPYFALELVDGATLLEHARRAELDLVQRLELFLQVCAAVQHAHESGILHRDLKPSNIVVDAAGTAKVLDFGVARVLEREGGSAHALTGTGGVVGTLATMSPEQVSHSSDELDARSDVYSLGVIAYELLTGVLPLELTGLALPEAARRICEQDPAPAGQHDRRLGGDLETILAKALEKDRARRYASAREFANDVRRYLRREPITARAHSTFYHLRMFARRNRALVAGLVVAVLALLAGTLVTGWFAWREARLRAQAELSRARAEREAYRANVIAAGLALEQGNALHARRLLADVARLERGWEWHRIQRGAAGWLTALELDLAYVWQAGFLGTSRTGVAVAQDGAAVLWDVETGAHLLALAPDEARRGPLALSADGQTVLSVQEREACLWDVRSGRERARFATDALLPTDPRGKAALAPDGLSFVLSTSDRGLLQFEVGSRSGPRARLPHPALPAISGDGRVLAASSEHELVLWELGGAELRRYPPVHAARALALAPDGANLAVSAQRRVLLFAADEPAGTPLLPALPDDATALAFSPDARQLAALLDDGSLWLWDVADGRVLERFGVGQSSWKTSLAWSADGGRLLSAAHAHRTVRAWSGREGREGEVLSGHTSFVYPVAYSADGARIVSGGWDDTLRVWSAASGRLLATLASRAGRVHALALAPDGRVVVAATGEGDLVAWDLWAGLELARVSRPPAGGCLAWSPRGALLAAANEAEPGRIRLLDPRTLAQLGELADPAGPGASITALCFEPGGTRLASAGRDGLLALWDVEARELRTLVPGFPAVNMLAYSRDGQRLALAANGGVLALLDARTLVQRVDLVGHSREVFAAAFSPDGARLFSGGRDGILRVWDPLSASLLGEFRGHRDYIWSLAVSPDGARVLTGSGDGDLRQWESEAPAVSAWRREAPEGRRSEAAARVAALRAELGEVTAVAERLAADPTLGPESRQAALDELLAQVWAER